MAETYYGKPHIYPDGDQWCAVWLHHRDLAVDPAGFGDTPEDAVNDLRRNYRSKAKSIRFEEFEIGGICRQCKCFVPNGFDKPGCNRDDCPCQPPNKAEIW